MGKSFLYNLDANEKHPLIVKEASRVCANLWAEDPCPEVMVECCLYKIVFVHLDRA
jgi:hypothetical protein